MLIQLKNAHAAGKQVVELPSSRMKHALAKILKDEGYIQSVETVGNSPKIMLKIVLLYEDKTPAITGVRRVSKPGLRWYVGKRDIPLVVGGMGTSILSTPQGLMTGKNAKKHGIGGELLCEIW